ncbi:MAG: MOSC N-terminal beta barrel domain-containing protein [Pseudomonadota bacterium]
MKITALFRHPVKSHGREALEEVTLHEGQSMPFDRRWAVAHQRAKAEEGTWASCANFSRGSQVPELMAINAQFDEAQNLLTLSHPRRPDLTFNPDTEGDALIDWVSPITKGGRPPAKLMTLPERGYTDAEFPSVSLCNTASLDALSENAGAPLSPLRWRINVWFAGAPAWSEFDWVGKDLQLGEAVLNVHERIERCPATMANPETGARDLDTLSLLNTHWNHQDFGINCQVVKTGKVAVGDSLTVL